MRKLLSLLALLALAGCAVTPADREGQNTGTATAQASVAPRYQHQLEVDYSDGGTPFLRLVKVQGP